jgi:hypothetical protein
MRKNFLFIFVFSISVSYANPVFKTLVRKEGSIKTRVVEKEMLHLKSSDSFDGKFFKIVLKKSNQAISFNEQDQDLVLKAASIYYHLNKSREFWISEMKQIHLNELPQIIVRLEIINQFDEFGHFANDNRSPQFNNALSIPEGKTPDWVPEERSDSWNKEIWFRPVKFIPTKELGNLGPNPLTVSLRALENPLIDYIQNQFNVRLIEEFFYPTYVNRPLQEDLIRYAGTYAMMKLILHGSKYADRLFMDKYYYLDSALVPEIAYHEYAHIVLSDHLEMSHSTPVNEGMADFFAAIQAKTRKIYAKVPGRSNARYKDTQEKKKYAHWDEANRLATADFTLSVLWDVREALGEEIGDQVVLEARKYLNTKTSNISEGLLRAILLACEIKCEIPRRDKLILYEAFMWKGF